MFHSLSLASIAFSFFFLWLSELYCHLSFTFAERQMRETKMTLSGVSFPPHLTVWQNSTGECGVSWLHVLNKTNSICILVEMNTNIPLTNTQFPQHRQEKHETRPIIYLAWNKPATSTTMCDTEDRSSDQRDNGGYWLAGRSLSKCTRTTPLQITAVIYFYTSNEAVRDGLHCLADLWIPMRGAIVSRWPWSVRVLDKSTV